MFGMESWFGHNKEAKDDSLEASKLTGREAPDIVDDISERQEHFTSPEGREEKMRIGVEKILDEFPISPEHAKGERDFISEKLLERGFVTARDQSLAGYEGVLKDVIDSVAGERIAARQKKDRR